MNFHFFVILFSFRSFSLVKNVSENEFPDERARKKKCLNSWDSCQGDVQILVVQLLGCVLSFFIFPRNCCCFSSCFKDEIIKKNYGSHLQTHMIKYLTNHCLCIVQTPVQKNRCSVCDKIAYEIFTTMSQLCRCFVPLNVVSGSPIGLVFMTNAMCRQHLSCP